MNARITSMENLIASDPGGRNVFGLVIGDQLRLAAQSLRLARRVGIVSGFFIRDAGAGETDGPPGALAVGRALEKLGVAVVYITDRHNAPLFEALGSPPMIEPVDFIDRAGPTHLISIERAGRGRDGRYRNMRGDDISDVTAPLDDLFLEAARRGITTIGIGDGGNEIGMGNVFASTLATIPHGREIACVVPADFCIAAGVSNWGAYGLAGALSVLAERDLLPTPAECIHTIETLVRDGGAVDGRTHRREPTVDGLPFSESLRMLEEIRSLIAPSPLEKGGPLSVGILGFGQTGRAAARLLSIRGHRVRVSDAGSVSPDPWLSLDAIETHGHTIEFLDGCDLVVASPGVRPDSPIRNELHARGIPVMSELEMAYQLCDRPIIAVTGTVGKRSTVELLQKLLRSAGFDLLIGGNKGEPLSALLVSEGHGGDGEKPRHEEHCHDQSEPRASARPDLTTSPSRDSFLNRDHEGAKPPSTKASRKPIAKLPEYQIAKSSNHPITSSHSVPFALAVSSFQLETVVHFRPHIAVLLNIDEAHMDRHRSIAEYVRIKSRVFMNHHPDDVLVLPFDDERLRLLARKHHGRTLFISTQQEVDRGAWIAGDHIHVNVDGPVEEIPRGSLSEFPYSENLLAAVLVARLCGAALP